MKRFALTIIFFTYVVLADAQPYCDDFNKCLNEAKRYLEKNGGREYYRNAAIHHFEMLEERLKYCVTNETKEQSFTIILLLNKKGEQIYTAANSSTNYASCVLSVTKEITFPEPPFAQYWLFMNMGYNPNPMEWEG